MSRVSWNASAVSIRAVALASVTGLALLAGQGAFAQARLDRSKTVVFANGGVVNTLDPMRTDYVQTSFVVASLYDTLVDFDASVKIVGKLAASYKVADDVKSISFTLRPDAKFHDGTPVRAKDVAYTLDRLKRVGIGIAAQVAAYDSTVVTDDLNFTIKLNKPSSMFLGALSKIFILNSALVAANAGSDDGQAWLQSRDAGSGPFKLDSVQGPTITVSQFDGYWAKAEGRPQAIVYRRIDESATIRDELKAGNVDIAIVGLSYRDADTLEKDGISKDAHIKPALQTNIVFNTKTGPTADPKIRKALRLGYDYTGGLEQIRLGNGVVANGPLPSNMPCGTGRPVVKRDVAEAKRLLAEAGAKDLTLTMRFQSAIEVQRLEATLFQSNMREIGVTVNLEPITFAAYLPLLRSFDTVPQVILVDDFAQYPDPGAILVPGYRSDAVGSNKSAYANPEIDKLLDEAVTTRDDAKRCDLYKQISTTLDDQSVLMPLYTVGRPIAYRPQQLKEPPVSYTVFPLSPADFRLAKP